jgi:hypothetical protein
VAVTQQFNTTTSMEPLTLNVLLSFAQFKRELAGERIRDKFAASRGIDMFSKKQISKVLQRLGWLLRCFLYCGVSTLRDGSKHLLGQRPSLVGSEFAG